MGTDAGIAHDVPYCCLIQQPAVGACFAYQFSEVVEASLEYAAGHCPEYTGDGLPGAQQRGKVFCEYNSVSCNVGTCQCYNRQEGTVRPDGSCSVQQAGQQAQRPRANNFCAEGLVPL